MNANELVRKRIVRGFFVKRGVSSKISVAARPQMARASYRIADVVRTDLTDLLSFRAIGVRSWLKGWKRSGLNCVRCGFVNRILIRRCCGIGLEVVASKVFGDGINSIYLATFCTGFFAPEKEHTNIDYANERNKDPN